MQSCASYYSRPIKWKRPAAGVFPLLSLRSGLAKAVVPTDSGLKLPSDRRVSRKASFPARLARIYRFRWESSDSSTDGIFGRLAVLWGFMPHRLPWLTPNTHRRVRHAVIRRQMHLPHRARSTAYSRFVKFLASYDLLLHFISPVLLVDAGAIKQFVRNRNEY